MSLDESGKLPPEQTAAVRYFFEQNTYSHLTEDDRRFLKETLFVTDEALATFASYSNGAYQTEHLANSFVERFLKDKGIYEDSLLCSPLFNNRFVWRLHFTGRCHGHLGKIHGGLISAVNDHMFGFVCMSMCLMTATLSMQITYLSFMNADETYYGEVFVRSSKKRKIKMSLLIRSRDGRTCISSEALFLVLHRFDDLRAEQHAALQSGRFEEAAVPTARTVDGASRSKL